MIKNLSKTKAPLEAITMFMLIAQTGFPFFVGDVILGVFAIITALFFLYRRPTIHKFFVKYLLGFVILLALQIIMSGQMGEIGPILGILARITYAYLAIKVIGIEFPKRYVNFMYFFTKIGFVFWVILAFVPGAYDAALQFSIEFIQPLEIYPIHIRNNLIIYTNDYWLNQRFPRNAGPFWEAGAYGVFLVVAILLHTMETNTLINRKNVVFMFALFTTFSLGSYAAFLVFLIAYSYYINRFKNTYTLGLAVLILGIFAYSFNRIDFLGEKFKKRENKVGLNINERTTYGNLNKQIGRNEKMRLDLRAFARSPLFGEGQSKGYKFGNSPSGVTTVLRKWGILGFSLLFVSLFYAFKRYAHYINGPPNFAKVALITFLAVGLPQSIWGKPFFIAFTFMYLVLLENNAVRKPTAT